MVSRYLIFGFPCHYPSGGMNDFLGWAKNMDEVIEILTVYKPENNHVLDLTTGQHIEVDWK